MGVLCTVTYTFLYTWDDWKVNYFSKEPRQNHALKKAEKASNFITEAKP